MMLRNRSPFRPLPRRSRPFRRCFSRGKGGRIVPWLPLGALLLLLGCAPPPNDRAAAPPVNQEQPPVANEQNPPESPPVGAKALTPGEGGRGAINGSILGAGAAGEKPPQDFQVVRLFYATDRKPLDGGVPADEVHPSVYLPLAAAVCGALLLAGIAYRFPQRRRLLAKFSAAGLVLVIGLQGLAFGLSRLQGTNLSQLRYGTERGHLQYGVCEVSVPARHEVGQLESPSLLRLELKADPRKHLLLRSTESRERDLYFEELRRVVRESPRRDVLIFVHGFNTSFEKGARRTAQIAYDVRFSGAPILYSWPSQEKLLSYPVDETNAEWTVPHLKQFLLEVAERSEAEAINLVAHSMGNRALTRALREIALELREESRLFNQIILAAPDVDAEIFKRDIAPALAQTGRGVTLYASSSDQALLASKKFHGYPRAGESGEWLVVFPGIETVDVSGIDLSLLGHGYYGENDRVIEDLHTVIDKSWPAQQRTWLLAREREGLPYWLFPPPSPAGSPE